MFLGLLLARLSFIEYSTEARLDPGISWLLFDGKVPLRLRVWCLRIGPLGKAGFDTASRVIFCLIASSVAYYSGRSPDCSTNCYWMAC